MIQSKAIWNAILLRLVSYHDLGKYPTAEILEQGFTLTIRFVDGKFTSLCLKNAIGQPEDVFIKYISIISEIIEYKLEKS